MELKSDQSGHVPGALRLGVVRQSEGVQVNVFVAPQELMTA